MDKLRYYNAEYHSTLERRGQNITLHWTHEMPTLSTFVDNHLLLTWQMSGNQNQRDCNDSSNDITCTDLFSSQTLLVWESTAKQMITNEIYG